ncbi:unnamed protein product [Paramecium pentaurelia]|uniref:Uncharacterized protein n=1 Tax=Paramecium pentaurelia TaxID=43138 RepID=A0A8S1TWN8_9CILI|nr:unnamed protein product [Paramecium pentaurelia]
MNNSFSAEAQSYQVRSVTTRQNIQRTSNGEFQDAVQRYELRRSSKPRQTQNNQQTTVITSKYVQMDNEGRNNNYDLEASRQSQRVLEKYQMNSQNSHYEVNRQSVKEVMDKYRRGRGTTTSQLQTTEVKYSAIPQPQYEQLQQKETVFEGRNSRYVEEQDYSQEKQMTLNYNTIQTKQQVYEVDYEQIKEDCQINDLYRRPEREDDVQIDLLESDYVSCNIF